MRTSQKVVDGPAPAMTGAGTGKQVVTLRTVCSDHRVMRRQTASGPLLLVIDPYAALIGRPDAVFDPAYAFHTRPDVGIAQRLKPLGLSPVGRFHGNGKTVVEIGPSLEQAFGMTRADTVVCESLGLKIAHPAL